MRADMYKVIVERPRKGSGWALKSDGRIFRNSEHAPPKVGMKHGYQSRKWLNENLSPLKRFLGSQIGRPWNKVYSELSQGIDRRNTVQEHIYAHIEQFVAIHTEWDSCNVQKPNDGDCVKMIERPWFGGQNSLRDSHFELFVHPRTGLLLRNQYFKRWSVKNREKRAQAQVEQAKKKKIISSKVELSLNEGHWFELTFEQFPKFEHNDSHLRWDALEKKLKSGRWPDRYVVGKRQLSRRDLKAQNLTGLFFILKCASYRYPNTDRPAFAFRLQALTPPACRD
jgi:hypothetical protein